MYKLQSLLLCVAALLLFSCKKENAKQETPPPANGEKYAIQLKAGGFTQHIENGRSASAREGDSLQAHIKYLYYFLFGENSNIAIKKIVQDSSGPDFGVIADTVTAGKYKIALLGTNQVLSFQDNDDYRNYAFFGNGPFDSIPPKDAFAKTFDVVVNGPVNQSVLLDRIVAKVEIVIADRVPFDAARLTADFWQGTIVFDYYSYKPVYGYGFHFHHYFTEAEKGAQGVRIPGQFLVVNEYSVPQLHLTYYDANNNKIASKVIDNNAIILQAGKKTVITGNMMDGAGGDGLIVDVRNPQWSADSIQVYF